ncbi:dihydropteroate synthase [Cystoisospora suis]|uniref:Dihydropteroate synthase n=1 Tax=Cystoisospora suis TaxID=483139 RepID=A0A2C6LC68_9APIC|nr:dihydropteroate synthase [Cystoisospora suis]
MCVGAKGYLRLSSSLKTPNPSFYHCLHLPSQRAALSPRLPQFATLVPTGRSLSVERSRLLLCSAFLQKSWQSPAVRTPDSFSRRAPDSLVFPFFPPSSFLCSLDSVSIPGHHQAMEMTRAFSSDPHAKNAKRYRVDTMCEKDSSGEIGRDSHYSATAYIALGSNLEGTERLGIIERAIKRLSKTLGPIQSTSCLYETVPGFDVCPPGVPHDLFHPFYLNAVVKLKTNITDPWRILELLKSLEAQEGRPLPPPSLSDRVQYNNDSGACTTVKGENKDGEGKEVKVVRGAPRSLDLDLLFMDDERGVSLVLNHKSNLPRKGKNLWEVILPHPRLAARNFVLFPLCDIDPLYVHPVEGVTLQELLRRNLIRRQTRLQCSVSGVCTPGEQGSGVTRDMISPTAGEHGYTLDGCLTIPRRCFAATNEVLWTVGGQACLRDTLRYIEEVKAYARRVSEEEAKKLHGNFSSNGQGKTALDKRNLHLSGVQLEQLEWIENLGESLEKEHMLRVMGILNVSPDSFTDHFAGDVFAAVCAAEDMLKSGADVIDIGGEATSTFKEKGCVPPQEEISRVAPVVGRLRQKAGEHVVLSVDTMKGEVARHVKSVGADWINDQTGEQRQEAFEDPLHYVSENPTTVVIMHKRGTPDTFDEHRSYDDVVKHVGEWLARTATSLQQKGVGRWRIMADVGLGISKSQDQSYALLGEIQRIKRLLPTGIPQLVGFSRKRFVGYGVGEAPSKTKEKASPEAMDARRWGGAAIVAWCTSNSDAVAVVRTHDVEEACRVRNVMECINRSGQAGLERFDSNPDISALFPSWPYTDSELKNAS